MHCLVFSFLGAVKVGLAQQVVVAGAFYNWLRRSGIGFPRFLSKMLMETDIEYKLGLLKLFLAHAF